MNITLPAAVHAALVPDRDAPYRLLGVYEGVADGCRETLALDLDGASLTFAADPDTDALEARFADAEFHAADDLRPLEGSPFDRFVGRELGWTWSAVNQQGYCDTALLSFGGIVPGVLVHVIGSAVRAFGVSETAA